MQKGEIFNVLIVDDSPVAAYLLKTALSSLGSAPKLHFAENGAEAMAFLRRQEKYAGSARPDLILLDMNMPKLNGIETLSAIKGDQELRAIPVIMFSSSTSISDVRTSYDSHANAYVEKPDTFDRFLAFAQALEAFWMRVVHLPQSGRPTGTSYNWPALGSLQASGCAEHAALSNDLAVSVRELIELHQQELAAFSDGDSEFHRFDILSHMANDKKQRAKYALLRHVEEHGCATSNAEDRNLSER